MNYLQHFRLNIKVALKCLMLVFFHLAHGILPIKLTDHKYWKIGCGLKKRKTTVEKLPQIPTIQTSEDYRKAQGYTSSRDYWVKQGVLKKRTIEKDW